MYFTLCAISGIITILLRSSFYNHVMPQKSEINRAFFWICSCINAFIMLIYTIFTSGHYSVGKALLTIFINISFDLILTLFYSCSHFYHRIIFCLVFFSFSAVSEFTAASLLYVFIPDFDKTIGFAQDAYVISASSLILCCIVVIANIISSKLSVTYKPPLLSGASLRRALLSISTPILSIALLFLFCNFHKLTTDESKASLLIFFSGILVLNIVNYILLNDLSRLSHIEEQLRMQKKQLDFQAANYDKISHSYREGRRIIHEVKRFNSYILACAEKNECSKIIDYINSNNNEMEKRLLCVNTGNLVIDSLVSNYDAIARNLGLKYSFDIQINAGDIPLSDYDMCIILGNLSDNSFNAARAYMGKHPSGSDDAWIDMKLITKQRFFVIRIENICSDDNPSHSESVSQLTHGYGLINVRNIVEKYNGLYYQETADGKYSTTVSIPILRDSVGAIIRQPASFERYEPNIN